MQRLDQLFYQHHRGINKSQLHCNHKNDLLSLRRKLRTLLLDSHEKLQCKLCATYYNTSNKADKSIAACIRGARCKSKIPFLFHPVTKTKLFDPQKIADSFSRYYNYFYNIKDDMSTTQPSPELINAFLNNNKLPSLSAEQLLNLNEPFTHSEICTAIDSLPNNKAPGPDGLPGEYYKQHKLTLAPKLCSQCNHAASSSLFSKDMLRGLIITLSKPGKDPSVPQNFFPISLLNTDLNPQGSNRLHLREIDFRNH